MKFSARFEYALLALLYLKCEPDESPVSGRILSEKLNLPYRFLEQILTDLKKAGLVRSVRGYHGGYRLALEPEAISLFDVFQVTEGKLEPYNCAQGESGDKCAQSYNHCVISGFYGDIKQTMTNLLKSYTLVRLCQASKGAALKKLSTEARL